jgi:GTP-binding protein Era
MAEDSAQGTGAARCGYVAIIGAPNAGKSTLLNQIVGMKLSIVSRKVQTTRMRVLGIKMHGAAQIVFVDTPGIFRPKRRLDRAMVAAAFGAAEDADIVVLLIDAAASKAALDPDGDTQRILAALKARKQRTLLALNKVDLISPAELLPLTDALRNAHDFAEIFFVSAEKGDGIEPMLDNLAAHLPLSPYLFPEEEVTDVPLRLLAAEITREKIFDQLHEELPYAISVETEAWETFADGSVKIDQVVKVTREGHKPIVLGKGGQRIKAIGTAARKEIAALVDAPVHLKLFVRVDENWAEQRDTYRTLGLDFEA